MAVGMDQTAKHLRRMPAPNMKGQPVSRVGKVGVALFEGRYIKVGQVTEEITDRLGGLVCCVNANGRNMLGNVVVYTGEGDAWEEFNPRSTNASDWTGAWFLPL